jgi:hypothetical protein
MAERVHTWLGLAALLVVVSGFVGWRAVGESTGSKVPAIVPSPQLTQLLPYSSPLGDTLRVVGAAGGDSIVLPRDPFVEVAPAPAAARAASSVGHAAAPEAPKWNVTATLTSGTRRAAVINDALIYVGDPVPGGGKLTSVERDRVVVTDARGAPHTVAVKEDNG